MITIASKKKGALKAPRRPRRSLPPAESIPLHLLEKLSRTHHRPRSRHDLFRDHLSIVDELAHPRSAFISICDVQRELLVVESLYGSQDEPLARACRPGEGIVGQAFQTGSSVGDSATFLALPIFNGSIPVGVLSICQARQPLDERVWGYLVGQLSHALGDDLARRELTQRKRELEETLAGLRFFDETHVDVLSNVSNEMLTPLATIRTWLEILLSHEADKLDDNTRQALTACLRNSDRLTRLISDMILACRLQNGEMTLDSKPIGLRALLFEAVGSLQWLADMTQMRVDVDAVSEAFVKGNREQLRNAFCRILENACLYSKPSGGNLCVRMAPQDDEVVLTFQDDGPGIAPEAQNRVFDCFYQGGHRRQDMPGSAGLGLAIVRRIVQGHGGRIDVTSTPDQGACFAIALPMFAGLTVRPTKRHPLTRPPGHVLLVEDDRDCQDALALMLEVNGYQLVSCRNQEAAIKALKKKRPALILLDLRIGNCNGRELLRHIRATPSLAELPVFVISGCAESEAGFRYDGEERIDGYFAKPFDMSRLLMRISEVFLKQEEADPEGPAGDF